MVLSNDYIVHFTYIPPSEGGSGALAALEFGQIWKVALDFGSIPGGRSILCSVLLSWRTENKPTRLPYGHIIGLESWLHISPLPARVQGPACHTPEGGAGNSVASNSPGQNDKHISLPTAHYRTETHFRKNKKLYMYIYISQPLYNQGRSSSDFSALAWPGNMRSLWPGIIYTCKTSTWAFIFNTMSASSSYTRPSARRKLTHPTQLS